MLFGSRVGTVARFEHRVVAVDRDTHDLPSPCLALSATAHAGEKLVESFLSEHFRHALQVGEFLGSHVRDRGLETSLDERMLVGEKGIGLVCFLGSFSFERVRFRLAW